MAKTSVIERNKKRIALVAKTKNRREKLIAQAKEVCNNPDSGMMDRIQAWAKVSKLPKNSAATRVRKRCNATGRPRGNNFIGVSRIMLRTWINQGIVPGITKSSW